MNPTPPAADPASEERVVGSDRVLAVLAELARHPDGIGLDEMARSVNSAKPTVHRALASLRRAGLAGQDGRGRYLLGDEFLRMAFAYHDARPDHLRVQPILQALTDEFGETSHYAVLDGSSIVYRAKMDPSVGAMRLASTVGARNPAHTTAAGKLLLSRLLHTEEEVGAWIGSRAVGARRLLHELERVRLEGYAVDDQENEPGVNCIAVPLFLTSPVKISGAISISALAYRTPLASLVDRLPRILEIVRGSATPAS